MPTVLRERGYRFHFYAGDQGEPAHVHVEKGESDGKVWLEPEVEAKYFHGFKAQERKEIMRIVNMNAELLKTRWYEFFQE